LVGTKGARLGLAHTAASEPHATSALADERLIVQRRRSQDDPSSCDHERRRTEDHREARHDPPQEHSEAKDNQARHGEARYRETDHRETRGPQDHDAPPNRWALDREAHHAAQLVDPQEAPLT
jgi:hypothetical protein